MMEINPTAPDREAWLTEAAHLIFDEIIEPHITRPEPPFRVSVGWPKGARGGKMLAQCFKRDCSEDGVNEIFVSPQSADSLGILGSVAHELIHATDDCDSGHRNFFAQTARKIGLEGPLTATHAGDKLTRQLQEYIDILGDIPHAAMVVGNIPKQTTRMVKMGCTSCDWHFRASVKQINAMNYFDCLSCENGEIAVCT